MLSKEVILCLLKENFIILSEYYDRIYLQKNNLNLKVKINNNSIVLHYNGNHKVIQNINQLEEILNGIKN